MLVINSDIMKKVRFFAILVAVTITSGLAITSCTTQHETDEMLLEYTEDCYHYFVRNNYSYIIDTALIGYGYEIFPTVILKDTVEVRKHFSTRCDTNYEIPCDVNLHIRQIQSDDTLTVDGYENGQKLKSHIFTAGEGIVNGKGVFHVDFMTLDNADVWAWCKFEIDKYMIVNKSYGHK